MNWKWLRKSSARKKTAYDAIRKSYGWYPNLLRWHCAAIYVKALIWNISSIDISAPGDSWKVRNSELKDIPAWSNSRPLQTRSGFCLLLHSRHLPQPARIHAKQNYRKHQNNIKLVQKRSSHDNSRAASYFDPLLIDKKNSETGTADRWGSYRRGKFPKKNNRDRLDPAQTIPRKNPDTDNGPQITDKHTHHCYGKPEHRAPAERNLLASCEIEFPE